MVCFFFSSLTRCVAYGCNLIIEHILYSAGRILIAMVPPVSQLVLYISLKSLNESPILCSACRCCCWLLLLLHSIHQYTFSDSHINFYFHIHTKPLLWFFCLCVFSFLLSFFIFVGLTANYQFQMIEKTAPITFIVDRPLKHTYTVTRCDNQWKYLLTKWFSGNWEYQAHVLTHSLTLLFTLWPRLGIVIINGNELKLKSIQTSVYSEMENKTTKFIENCPCPAW